jgi:hypothetical protein
MTRPLVSITDASYQMTLPEEEKYLATSIREMNDEEYAQYLADKAIFEAEEANRLAKQAQEDTAKAALQEKLAEMGITPELIEVIKKL